MSRPDQPNILETIEQSLVEWVARARLIAEDPYNVIDTLAGEDLVGVAKTTPDGNAVTADGEILWEKPPKVGLLPYGPEDLEQRTGPARLDPAVAPEMRVPKCKGPLADHLRWKAYFPGWETPIRLTYELRRVLPAEETDVAKARVMRFLSLQLDLRGQWLPAMVGANIGDLIEFAAPFVHKFFPLHEGVGHRHYVGAPVPRVASSSAADAGNVTHRTPLLIQFVADHDHARPVDARRGAVRLYGPDGKLI